MKIKALETEYNGILFRSRLEARWAIYFDALNVDYVYEPECYLLENNKKYTPDFYLQKLDLFIEIKPNTESLKEDYHTSRWESFVRINDKPLAIFISYPSAKTFPVYFKCNLDFEQKTIGAIFCPTTKYSPLYYNGADTFYEDEYFSKEVEFALNKVKEYRFWN